MDTTNTSPFLHNLESLEQKESIPQIVDEIIHYAIENYASDIHIEPTSHSLWIRLRLDGVLQTLVHLKSSLSLGIIARIKVLADLLSYQTHLPQDGSIRLEKTQKVEIRVSTIPILFGEKAVLRLLYTHNTKNFSLENLGFSQEVLSSLHKVLRFPQGVLLFTGPAGSGKTTSIYSVLNHLTKMTENTRNIVTVEDPVEHVLESVTQIQINHGVELTFSKCLRALLRQDPDIIMIGEVRDKQTAQIAVEAGLTGHFVVSTIHSGHSVNVFTRLLEMGIEPFLLKSAIKLIIAQRLLRILCLHCKSANTFSYKPGKCQKCKNTGYKGRCVIAEALPVGQNIRQVIDKNLDEKVLEKTALEGGMISLQKQALDLVDSGRTSLVEVQRNVSVT